MDIDIQQAAGRNKAGINMTTAGIGKQNGGGLSNKLAGKEEDAGE